MYRETQHLSHCCGLSVSSERRTLKQKQKNETKHAEREHFNYSNGLNSVSQKINNKEINKAEEKLETPHKRKQ